VLLFIPIGTDAYDESAGRNFRPQCYENKLNLSFEDGGKKFLGNVSTYQTQRYHSPEDRNLDNSLSLKKTFRSCSFKSVLRVFIILKTYFSSLQWPCGRHCSAHLHEPE
jgi:hypothetical protein